MKCLLGLAATAALLAPIARGDEPAAPRHDFPASDYETRTIRGFEVLVNRRLLEHPAESDPALAMLDSQLEEIVRKVPEAPLAALRKVRIWMEREVKPGGAAEFHPSAEWLKGHGYNPEKAGCVEISNARNFVDWSRRAQPWMVLHELAHAYHFRVLGSDNPAVASAFRNAIDRKLYEKVGFVTGGERKAYATTDRMEYFAELSEAYFGKNDFFPYTRGELETHDPEGFLAVRKAWERN